MGWASPPHGPPPSAAAAASPASRGQFVKVPLLPFPAPPPSLRPTRGYGPAPPSRGSAVPPGPTVTAGTSLSLLPSSSTRCPVVAPRLRRAAPRPPRSRLSPMSRLPSTVPAAPRGPAVPSAPYRPLCPLCLRALPRCRRPIRVSAVRAVPAAPAPSQPLPTVPAAPSRPIYPIGSLLSHRGHRCSTGGSAVPSASQSLLLPLSPDFCCPRTLRRDPDTPLPSSCPHCPQTVPPASRGSLAPPPLCTAEGPVIPPGTQLSPLPRRDRSFPRGIPAASSVFYRPLEVPADPRLSLLPLEGPSCLLPSVPPRIPLSQRERCCPHCPKRVPLSHREHCCPYCTVGIPVVSRGSPLPSGPS